MAATDFISRTGAAALINEEVSNAILTGVENNSAILKLARKVNMGTAQDRLPVLATLPVVGWNVSDTGSYQTTKMTWDNKYLNCAELYAVIPVPNKLLADADYDPIGSQMDTVSAQLAVALDAACILGTNKPSVWTDDAIATKCTSLTAYKDIADTAQGSGGIAVDISEVMAFPEADGFEVNGFVASPEMRKYLRNAVDTTGQPISTVVAGGGQMLYGAPIHFAMQGAWTATNDNPIMIAGDWSQVVVGVRQDVSVRVLKESTFFDSNGQVTLSLGQQDCSALVITARYAYVVANTITQQNPTAATRYPFGMLRR